MKLKRSTFSTGLVVALATARTAADPGTPVATLNDVTCCDGCEGLERSLCVSACREKNVERFPLRIRPYSSGRCQYSCRVKRHLEPKDRLSNVLCY